MARESGRIMAPADPLVGDPAASSHKRAEGVLDLITFFLGRKKTIAMVTAAGTLLALVISFILPVKYTAMTILLPPQQGQSLASAMSGQLGLLAAGLGSIGLKNNSDLYAGMLVSESVTNGVIEKLHLMDVYHVKQLTDARAKLRTNTVVKPILKQGTIQLSVEDSDPKRAAAIANMYIEQLHALNQRIALPTIRSDGFSSKTSCA